MNFPQGVVHTGCPQKMTYSAPLPHCLHLTLPSLLPRYRRPHKKMTGYKTPAVWQDRLAYPSTDFSFLMPLHAKFQSIFNVITILFTIIPQSLWTLMKWVLSCQLRKITNDEPVQHKLYATDWRWCSWHRLHWKTTVCIKFRCGRPLQTNPSALLSYTNINVAKTWQYFR